VVLLVVDGRGYLVHSDTTGTPVPSITKKGNLRRNLTFTNAGSGTATISDTPKNVAFTLSVDSNSTCGT